MEPCENVLKFIFVHILVQQFAENAIRPLVRQMDATSQMDLGVIKGVFENGFMGVEIPAQYDGPESTFFNTVLIVEELARVDPSVAVLVDVHNTLVVPVLLKYGSEEQKKKYLPASSKNWVSGKLFALIFKVLC